MSPRTHLLCRLYFTLGPLRSKNVFCEFENSHMVIFIIKFIIFWVIVRLLSVFETTALLNLKIYSIFLWLLLPDFIVLLKRVL